ncbi:hypothetical protein FHS60_000655 [Alloprevotella rava]|uniref:Uncharacterized protein n=1 Tax=Alloprevotella rava TaxID=671218 RepID=A0A7W5UIS6_9BACT|nr:hypothetical protein [Alloprevotella rava]
MFRQFLAVVEKHKQVRGRAPSISPIRGGVLGFGSRTGRTSRTGQTSPICPRTNTDSCSFAPFVLLRGLKLSTDFLLFPFHKRLKIEHERERAKKATFLCADFLIASAGTIRLSADRIRKPADTIRKLTERIRMVFAKNGRKGEASL